MTSFGQVGMGGLPTLQSLTGYPRTPLLLRGGLVQVDAASRKVLDVVVFQYNPDTVTRTLQPRSLTGEPGDRLEVLRLTGPPHETIKVDAEFDATEQLEHPDTNVNRPVASHGLLPVLAALEAFVTPTIQQLREVDALFDQGMLEVVPMEAPLTLLVWGAQRVLPVLISSLSVTEEAFDRRLNPIRAKASIEMKVLTSVDLPVQHTGGALYLAYRQQAEGLAASATSTNTRPLGFERLP
jgi:hypothetical protein